MSTTKTKSEKTLLVEEPDPIAMLKSDHEKVTGLFQKYEKNRDNGSAQEKWALVRIICNELLIHAALEEELFYPTVREKIHDDEMMDEATVEHASAKSLIYQLEEMALDDPMMDAKVKVLGDYIRHHVKEEQEEMFPKVRKADLDLEALGLKMAKLKQKLMATNKH